MKQNEIRDTTWTWTKQLKISLWYSRFSWQ